jgi:DNA-binding transcriptional regulator YiaG
VKNFAETINEIIETGFSPMEVATEFKVSLGTVERWRAGKSVPPTLARNAIISRIKDLKGGSL